MKSWALVLEMNDADGNTDRWPVATCGVSNRAGPFKVLKALEEASAMLLREEHNVGEALEAEIELLDFCMEAVKKTSKRK